MISTADLSLDACKLNVKNTPIALGYLLCPSDIEHLQSHAQTHRTRTVELIVGFSGNYDIYNPSVCKSRVSQFF